MKRLSQLLLLFTLMVMTSASVFANIASGTSGTCTWVIDDNGNMTFSPTNGTEGTLGTWSGETAVPWYSYRTSVKTVKFTGTVNAVTCLCMFQGCSNLTSIDLSKLNTSKVTNMSAIFSGCSGLTSLDLSNLDTSNATNMLFMFYGCSGLTSLDLSNLSTGNVTDMASMFYNCSGLTSLNVSKLNTSNVTDMNGMFNGCSKLTSLDLSKFNTAKVKSMSSMFNGCSGLTSLDLSNFNTATVTSMYSMFNGCSGLTSLDLSNFNTSNVTRMTSMFYGCSNLQTLNLTGFDMSKVTNDTSNKYIPSNMARLFTNCNALTKVISMAETPSTLKEDVFSTLPTKSTCVLEIPATSQSAYASATGWNELTNYSLITSDIRGTSGTCTWVIDDDGNMTISPNDGVEGTLGTWTRENDAPWAYYNKNIKTVKFTGKVNAQTCYRMFYGCSNATSIDLTGLNTSDVTIMEGMFNNCSSLKSLDVSNFDTSNVNSMDWMFSGCDELTSLDVSKFNTSQVYDMTYMFAYCSKLTTLDLSNFNTSTVRSMYGMFQNCSALTSLDLSSFDTSNANRMDNMFNSCSALTTLNISNFNTSNVTDMNNMFFCCSNLKSLDVSNFDTKNVTNMSYMFHTCSGLTSLDISNFSTSNVTNMDCMFAYSLKLQSINLTNFDMSAVTKMAYMFTGCDALTKVISMAATPSTLKEGVFEGLPTKETCSLTVPLNSVSAYQNAIGWKELGNITGIEITLTDGAPYTQSEDLMCAKVTYNRTFSEKVEGNWQCFYVPFDVSVTAELLEDYDFAKLYMISYKDIDGDGEISGSDPLAMLINKLSEGKTLKANTPYFVRAKSAGTMCIEVENVLLKAAATGTIDCWTTEHTYTLTGVYEPFCLNGYYTMNTSGSFSYYTEDKTLNPYRWYLDIEDRSGSKVEAKNIGVYVAGEDDTTGIVGISANENANVNAYSLDGRLINNLQSAPQGIYIVNGKKIIKK